MAVDQVLLRRLLDRSAYRFDAWTGSVVDRSQTPLPMIINGTPEWSRYGKATTLSQRAAGDGVRSTGAVPTVVDPTGTFYVTALVYPRTRGNLMNLCVQVPGDGGMSFFWDGANNRFFTQLYTNAGAPVQSVSSPNGVAPEPERLFHFAIASRNGGATGHVRLDDVPLVPAYGGGGVAAVGSDSQLNVAGCASGAGEIDTVLVWVFDFEPEDSEKTALYEAARNLVTPV